MPSAAPLASSGPAVLVTVRAVLRDVPVNLDPNLGGPQESECALWKIPARLVDRCWAIVPACAWKSLPGGRAVY